MLQIVTGRDECLRMDKVMELCDVALEQGARELCLIVPEQFTLAAERMYIQRQAAQGMLRVRVLSPSKLQNEIFAGTVACAQALDKRAITMSVRHCAKKLESHLSAYKNSIAFPGFARKAAELISAVKQSDASLDSETLERLSDTLLKEKLSDIALLWEALDEAMSASGSLDEDDRLALCIERIPQNKNILSTCFAFYAFNYLTPREIRLIEALEAQSAGVIVSLASSDGRTDSDIFAPMERLAVLLADAVRQRGSEVRYHKTSASGIAPCDVMFSYDKPTLTEGRVKIVSCADADEEAAAAAHYIADKMLNEGASPHDFFIACADLKSLAAPLSRQLAAASLPVFLDSMHSVMSNSVVSFVFSLLRAAYAPQKADDMLAMAACGVLGIEDSLYDTLCAYVREFGINTARAWHTPFKKGQDRYDTDALEAARLTLCAPVDALCAAAPGGVIQADSFARVLREQLEALDTENLLERDALMLEGLSMSAEAALCRRVWAALTDVIAQLSAIFKDEKISLPELSAILKSGMEASPMGIIPTGIEEISVGDLHRSRPGPVKYMLLIGAEEGSFGASSAGDGLVDSRECEAMSRIGIFLPMYSEALSAQDKYDIMTLASLGREELYISYKSAQSEDGTGRADQCVQRLLEAAQCTPTPAASLLERPASLGEARLSLTGAVRAQVLGRELTQNQSEALAYYLHVEPELTRRLFEAHASRGLAHVSGLRSAMGSLRRVTPSDIEAFYTCPARMFFERVLASRPLREMAVDALRSGNYLHEAMSLFAQSVREALAADPTLSRFDSDEVAQAIAQRMDRDFEYGMLTSTERLICASADLHRMLSKAARQYTEGVRRSAFRAPGAGGDELSFGQGFLPRAYLDTAIGPVEISARIDRLDIFPHMGSDYLRVMDYKSGSASLRADRVVNAHDMQTFMYLSALQKVWPRASGHSGIAAGAFIFPIKDDYSGIEEYEAGGAGKADRLNGWVLDNDEVATAMDSAIDDASLFSHMPHTPLRLSAAKAQALLRITDENTAAAVERLANGYAACEYYAAAKPCESCSYACVCERSHSRAHPRRELSTVEALQKLESMAGGENEVDR